MNPAWDLGAKLYIKISASRWWRLFISDPPSQRSKLMKRWSL